MGYFCRPCLWLIFPYSILVLFFSYLTLSCISWKRNVSCTIFMQLLEEKCFMHMNFTCDPCDRTHHVEPTHVSCPFVENKKKRFLSHAPIHLHIHDMSPQRAPKIRIKFWQRKEKRIFLLLEDNFHYEPLNISVTSKDLKLKKNLLAEGRVSIFPRVQ
jgi:hypothetical protein